MRLFCILFISVLSILQVSAQRSYEGGIYLGMASYYGEVGSVSIINSNKPFYGFIGKINFSDKIALRSTFTYVTLADEDRDSDVQFRADGRDTNTYYSFENENIEGSFALEYTFYRFFITKKSALSTYAFTGINVLFGDELYYPGAPTAGDIDAIEYRSRVRLSIPLGVGVKTQLSRNFRLGLDVAPRYALTDNLDGSDPFDAPPSAREFSDFKGNDLYTYVGFTLTYLIGDNRTDCFCW